MNWGFLICRSEYEATEAGSAICLSKHFATLDASVARHYHPNVATRGKHVHPHIIRCSWTARKILDVLSRVFSISQIPIQGAREDRRGAVVEEDPHAAFFCSM